MRDETENAKPERLRKIKNNGFYNKQNDRITYAWIAAPGPRHGRAVFFGRRFHVTLSVPPVVGLRRTVVWNVIQAAKIQIFKFIFIDKS